MAGKRRIAGLVVGVSLALIGAPAIAVPITVPPGRPSGTVVDWGSGPEPPPVGLTDVVDVASGGDYALALRADGTVVGWGSGSTPGNPVPADLRDVVAISATPWTAAALRRDGTVVSWGFYVPDTAALGSDNAAISAGPGFLLALKTDGTVQAADTSGTGATTVPAGLSDVIAVSAGGFRGVSGTRCGFGLALKADGTAVGWGGAPDQVGCSGNFAAPGTPPKNLRGLVGIEAGSTYSLGLKADGTVVAWGDPAYANATPPAGLRDVARLSAGEQGVGALRSDGSITTWGFTDSPPAGLTATALGVDRRHAVALTVPVGVGSPVLQTRVDSNAAGTAEAFRFTAVRSGPVDRLRFFVDASSRATQVQVGVYAANGGNPGTLLASKGIGVPAGDRWAEVSIPTVSLTAGTTYWIAVLGPRGAGRFAFRDRPDGSGGANQTSAQTGLTALPTSWRTGQTFANGPLSAYAVPVGS